MCWYTFFFFSCAWAPLSFWDLWVFIAFAKFENCWVAISSGFFLFYPLSLLLHGFQIHLLIYWPFEVVSHLTDDYLIFLNLSQCFISYSFYHYKFSSLIFSSTISNLLSILSSVCGTSDMVAPSLEV